jgi:3-methyl-2-oxobutanoate hydroxymethyltransferase
MAAARAVEPMTVPRFLARKGGEPLVCLTAYSTPIARLLDPFVDMLLVGDTVGVVEHGQPTTIGVTLEEMISHGKAVMRGAAHALVAVDLPFGSYEGSPAQAFAAASRVMGETGCAAVKLEGGRTMIEIVAFLAARNVPVIGHVGLRPQSVHLSGGYKTVGRHRGEWAAIEADAKAIAEAGAFAIVLEGMAEPLAARITEAVPVPTIGIGASARCDGQILVTNDLLGLTDNPPRFAKRFANLAPLIAEAVGSFAAEVRARRFPGTEHIYQAKD